MYPFREKALYEKWEWTCRVNPHRVSWTLQDNKEDADCYEFLQIDEFVNSESEHTIQLLV